ncbi:hypothetical protein PG294_09110 [Riemerella anatipestifer]|uniref:hypothetical protein n=1 Tax=Riemerella anatipestifer TaxID=34085 RepID=UPI0007ED8ED5|nr:hypothetical protein [Riemerella anatipestifer]MBT0573561.1 hypothetical protein [Riemerella anatipestifer]MCQ4155763.1 hypothetical protein [Riemerella anatipestifer]MDD1540313.1 hypothetical protein [Riemerella anatipestifer]MDR7694957.1 hypothetical protein [Riemerella anatipestifer]MDR7775831.1 hypothetical protein [Riemerella anatipestifer]
MTPPLPAPAKAPFPTVAQKLLVLKTCPSAPEIAPVKAPPKNAFAKPPQEKFPVIAAWPKYKPLPIRFISLPIFGNFFGFLVNCTYKF